MALLRTNPPKLGSEFRPSYYFPSSPIDHPPKTEPLGKRLFAAFARALHEQSYLFSASVSLFRALQRVGANLTPNHFYWPIPDLAELEKREWPTFDAPPRCHFQLRKQLELAAEWVERYGAECRFDSRPVEDSYHYANGYFESFDAEVAYCMVRHWKPSRIIEIGSGYSSRIMAAALRANMERHRIYGDLIAIDPRPARVPSSLGGLVTVIAKPVQDIDIELFANLQPNDILFIDSSHIVGVGSDLTRVYLQILPSLRPGVLVHFHDIFLPYDYPRDAVLRNMWFWSEQYLLQAFLSFNTEFEVIWSASAIQREHTDLLELYFPHWKHSYREIPEARRRFIPTRDQDHIWPSSFWIRRVEDHQN